MIDVKFRKNELDILQRMVSEIIERMESETKGFYSENAGQEIILTEEELNALKSAFDRLLESD